MTGPWVGDHNVALLTDLYELTMAGAYLAEGITGTATFELSVRSLPYERNFLVAAGIDDAIRILDTMRFGGREVGYLRSLERFDETFLSYLEQWDFAGEVWAIPEGTVCFGAEPLMRVTAPLIHAQVIETLLLNTVGFQTLIASKAARVAVAAEGTPFIDFGARRSHGADAALRAARAAYIAGADATSMVLAGSMFGIPVTGTMAHSYVMGHESEREAFLAFARSYPADAVLLIDTYDTIEGARIAAAAALQLASESITVQAVRLDSGNLAALAFGVREILDETGLRHVRILASGGLDEHGVARLLQTGAPIDGFGVGTAMVVSTDAPSLDIIYKMVHGPAGPVMKTSSGKVSLPGIHQVYRQHGNGNWSGDVIALADEHDVSGEPLLAPVMEQGRRAGPVPDISEARRRCREGIEAMPLRLRGLGGPADPPYPVAITPALEELATYLGEEPLDWPPDHPDQT